MRRAENIDEIDEITQRSGKPHVYLAVDGRREPFPAVVLTLKLPGRDGLVNAIRMPYTLSDARELADTILGTADAVELDANGKLDDIFGDRPV